jgi:hypothetical protein
VGRRLFLSFSSPYSLSARSRTPSSPPWLPLLAKAEPSRASPFPPNPIELPPLPTILTHEGSFLVRRFCPQNRRLPVIGAEADGRSTRRHRRKLHCSNKHHESVEGRSIPTQAAQPANSGRPSPPASSLRRRDRFAKIEFCLGSFS